MSPTPNKYPRIYNEWEKLYESILKKQKGQPHPWQTAFKKVAERYNVTLPTVREYLRVGHKGWCLFNLTFILAHDLDRDYGQEFTIDEIKDNFGPSYGKRSFSRKDIWKALNVYSNRFDISPFTKINDDLYKLNDEFWGEPEILTVDKSLYYEYFPFPKVILDKK